MRTRDDVFVPPAALDRTSVKHMGTKMQCEMYSKTESMIELLGLTQTPEKVSFRKFISRCFFLKA